MEAVPSPADRIELQVKLCECGCTSPAPIAKMTNRKLGHVRGQPVRFVRGHAARVNPRKPQGFGLLQGREGRWAIWCCDGSRVYFSRAVMEAELRRPLRGDEEVHHINRNPTDDRCENLEVLSHREHAQRHRPSHCRRGHPLSGENLYTSPDGRNQCRICARMRNRKRARTVVA
jgi:hypothetical protein